ncbi:hypothetical protein MRQ36_01840 [Micromonospora sp. R77]|uniref:hypothetical protein n=1 Tax=Micromonospora sp. R77 TaxID=2925836 RepID=UPI001F6245F2|nr:hypothetical protein [Micromonospora sp. R77]MCI4061382.1 hypothetical protein [Micromonospora sp. R77]
MPGKIIECLGGTLQSVPGRGFYFQAGLTGGDLVDEALRSTAQDIPVPSQVAMFLRTDIEPAHRDGLRSYLENLDSAARAIITLVALSPLGVLVDATRLREFADRYDLPVYAPASMRGEESFVAVDATGTETAAEPAAHLVLPRNAMAQRTALERLSAALERSAADPAAQAEQWLSIVGDLQAELGVEPAPTADQDAYRGREEHATTYAIGTYISLFHRAPDQLTDLRTRTRPLGVGETFDVIGARPAMVEPQRTIDFLRTHPGAAALVSGLSFSSPTRQLLWLTSGGDGALSWADPRAGERVPFSVDSSADWRTSVLYGEETVTAVFDSNGEPTALPDVPAEILTSVPPAPLIGVPPGAIARPRDGMVLIGDWPESAQKRLGLDRIDVTGLPVVALDVQELRTERTLDPGQRNVLGTTLQRLQAAGARPIVIASARSDVVEAIVQRHRGTLMQVIPKNLDFTIEVRTGSTVSRTSGPLDQQAVNDAAAPGQDRPLPVPPVVRGLLNTDTWEQARDYVQANLAELTTRSAVDGLREMREATTEPEQNDLPGTAELAPSDRRLRAFEVIAAIGTNVGFRAGETALEPTARLTMTTEPPIAFDRSVDLTFVFDYLTARSLPPIANDSHVPGPYQTRLLWDGLLFQAMLDRKIAPQQAVVLRDAADQSPADTARITIGELPTGHAHALIFDAVSRLLERYFPEFATNAGRGADWETVREHLRAVLTETCLTGEDRVPWHFRLEKVFLPLAESLMPEPKVELLTRTADLKREINFCH